jgi:hypothetical protein
VKKMKMVYCCLPVNSFWVNARSKEEADSLVFSNDQSKNTPRATAPIFRRFWTGIRSVGSRSLAMRSFRREGGVRGG